MGDGGQHFVVPGQLANLPTLQRARRVLTDALGWETHNDMKQLDTSVYP